MPRSSRSGNSTRRRSVSPASDARSLERPRLEDRPGTVENRARMAGGIHGQAAAGAKRAPGREHVFRLLGKGNDLLVAEPEANARSAPRSGAVLAGCRLAGDQDEHLAGFVVAQTHLAALPFGLAGGECGLARGSRGGIDSLGLQHLMNADYERLDLRF